MSQTFATIKFDQKVIDYFFTISILLSPSELNTSTYSFYYFFAKILCLETDNHNNHLIFRYLLFINYSRSLKTHVTVRNMDYINPNVQCTQNGQTYVKNHAAVMATKTFNVCFTIFWTLGIIGCSKEFFFWSVYFQFTRIYGHLPIPPGHIM